MKLSDAYGPGKFGLSFELFPPKSDAGDVELFQHLEELVAFEPSYITCTYGAGGSTRQKTLDVVARVRQRFGATVASHLTCVGSTADELRAYLRESDRRGVENIVALRGDPPKGQAQFQAVEGGLRFASELVRLIRGEFPQFGIAVAGYPETHQEAVSPQADLENLQRKVAAGGDVVITQLFYDNSDFFRFRDRCDRCAHSARRVAGDEPGPDQADHVALRGEASRRLPGGPVALR
jgi:methylenetetrahydrofolate reductase (NADPH)